MLYVKKQVAIFLILLLSVIALASTINLVKAVTYQYNFEGPFYMNGNIATGNTVVCNLLWSNYTTSQFTLTTAAPEVITSSVQLYQMTWNSSSVSGYTNTSLIEFIPSTTATTQTVSVFIPNTSLPFGLYTFSITDFAGMTNPYLRMTINNASGLNSAMAEQVNLDTVGSPVFVMTQYYTYTLTFICDQGTYSRQFTAESSFTETLPVLAGAFPTANVTTPTTLVERINATMIGISYDDPSLSTSAITVDITHKSGVSTIADYSLSTTGNSATILWNGALSGMNYNVNFTAVINGVSYIWVLVAPEEGRANPFLGVFDFLGKNTATMPHVQTGWPEGMTSAQIAQIIGASVVMLFLCIGSFRSAGACCMLSWIIFGIMLWLGWLNIATPYAIPQFAFSGFVGILIMIDESKQTTREV
jgi:hypothetical protein